MKEQDVRIWKNSDCQNKYKTIHIDDQVTDSHICAGSLFKDSCQGDSGGTYTASKSL